MNDVKVQQQLEEINKKLDRITARMAEQEKGRQEWKELKNDLTLIGTDVFNSAVEELQDVAIYFDSRDLVFLLKKLLRNTRTLINILNQLESAANLVEDVKPLSKDMFDELLQRLQKFEEKGYFQFMRHSARLFDTVIADFSPEDLEMLNKSLPYLLRAVKSLTKPDVIVPFSNALEQIQNIEIDTGKDISYRSLFRQLRDPDVRKAMAFMLEFIKSVNTPENKKVIKENR